MSVTFPDSLEEDHASSVGGYLWHNDNTGAERLVEIYLFIYLNLKRKTERGTAVQILPLFQESPSETPS